MTTSTTSATTFRALFGALIVVASFGLALAKLPPPPPMDDAAKAAAEQKKAKDATAAEAAKQIQARAEDRVAEKGRWFRPAYPEQLDFHDARER